MSTNTPITYLLKSGLNAVMAKADPKFEIKYCLPIYDNETDDYVMVSRVTNPGVLPEGHDSAAPSDFKGAFFTRESGIKYVLEAFPESGTGVIPASSTTGWKSNPPFTQYCVADGSETALALATGSEDTKSYSASVVDGELYPSSSTLPVRSTLTSWSADNLYSCVRYLGTKMVDVSGESVKTANYSIFLRAEDGNNESSVRGSIRFNKVLIFDGTSGTLTPIALICLPNAISITSKSTSLAVANSTTINFNFGFNPEDIDGQEVTYDNSYWSRILDYTGDIKPVYFPGKMVLGNNPDGEKMAEATINVLNNLVGWQSESENGYVLHAEGFSKYDDSTDSPERPYLLDIGSVYPKFCSIDGDVGISGMTLADYSVLFARKSMLEGMTVGSVNSSFAIVNDVSVRYCNYSVHIGRGYGNSTGETRLVDSVNVGENIYIKENTASLVIAKTLTGMPTSTETNNYTGELRNSLIIGSNNNVGVVYFGDLPTETEKEKPIVIVGHDNKIYKGANYTDKRTSTYVFGSNNTITNGAYETNFTRFIFGDGMTINASPVNQNYEYEDTFVVGGMFMGLKTGEGEKSPVKLLSIGVRNSGSQWNTGLIKLPISDKPVYIPNVGTFSGFDIPVLNENDRPGWTLKGVISRAKKGTTLASIQEMIDAGYVPLFTYVGTNDD